MTTRRINQVAALYFWVETAQVVPRMFSSFVKTFVIAKGANCLELRAPQHERPVRRRATDQQLFHVIAPLYCLS